MNPAIPTVIYHGFFKRSRIRGNKIADYEVLFDAFHLPLISLAATVICWALREYETGVHRKGPHFDSIAAYGKLIDSAPVTVLKAVLTAH
jgi:hypothetical protein